MAEIQQIPVEHQASEGSGFPVRRWGRLSVALSLVGKLAWQDVALSVHIIHATTHSGQFTSFLIHRFHPCLDQQSIHSIMIPRTIWLGGILPLALATSIVNVKIPSSPPSPTYTIDPSFPNFALEFSSLLPFTSSQFFDSQWPYAAFVVPKKLTCPVRSEQQ